VQPYVRPLPKEALAKGSLTLSKKERAALEMEKSRPEEGKDGDLAGNEPQEAERLGDKGVGEEINIPKEA
jgi:tRNA-dihydrouridine synthase 1